MEPLTQTLLYWYLAWHALRINEMDILIVAITSGTAFPFNITEVLNIGLMCGKDSSDVGDKAWRKTTLSWFL